MSEIMSIDAPSKVQWLDNHEGLTTLWCVATVASGIGTLVWSILWASNSGQSGMEDWRFTYWWLSQAIMSVFMVAVWIKGWCMQQENLIYKYQLPASFEVTNQYKKLSPITKDLMRPVVEKIYELERKFANEDFKPAEVTAAISERKLIVSQVVRDEKEILAKNLTIDRTDLDTVEYVLQGRKELESI